MFDNDIRINTKKVLDTTIRQVYQKYKWQPNFIIIEDLANYRILIRFRIGLTDFALNVDVEHLDLNHLAWCLKFEEEFLKCEEMAKARLAYDGKDIINDRITALYRNDRKDRIAKFDKILADEKKHKRLLRKKFVERIREIL